VKQLAQQCRPFPPILKEFYTEDADPEPSQCIKMLEALEPLFHKCFVVIDALDECDNDAQKHRQTLLQSLTALMNTNIRIFATSRTTFDDINETFAGVPKLQISADKQDLRT
jgi:hypothetical protein